MALQQTPQVARDYAAAQRARIEATSRDVERLWSRVGDDFNPGFERIAPELIATLNGAQLQMAQAAQEYVPAVLEATGQANLTSTFEIEPRQWVGTSGDGRATEAVAYGAVVKAKESVRDGMSVYQALSASGRYLTLATRTMLADTMRGAEGASGYSHRVGGYVRQIQGETCGRCIILAGKWFRKNRGFQRHPKCDCIHIPTAENVAGDMTTSPVAYLDSLDDDALAKALGSRANARAYREFGATPNQLVNAYRRGGAIKTAQHYGHAVKYTLEGTTRRGVAYHQMSRVRALSMQGETKGARYRRLNAPRLMPESIFSIAKNQDHATRLLRDHGWLGITN